MIEEQVDVDEEIRQKNRAWTNQSIEEKVNCLSKVLFCWTSNLINLGNLKSGVRDSDLFEIPQKCKFKRNMERVEEIMLSLKKKKTKNIVNESIIRLVGGDYLVGVVMVIAANIFQLLGPVFVNRILGFIQQEQKDGVGEGLIYVGLVWLSFMVGSVLLQNGMHRINKVAIMTQNALESIIYNKIVRLKCSSKQYVDIGQMVNLATTDVQIIFQTIQRSGNMINGPFLIVMCLILITIEVGIAGLAGVVILGLGLALSTMLGRLLIRNRVNWLKLSDQRGKVVSECINGIRVLKYYGWEYMTLLRVQSIRNKENRLIVGLSVMRSVIEIVGQLLPTFFITSVLGIYIADGNKLTPQKAFTILAYFNLIQYPIRFIGILAALCSNYQVSMKRINDFQGWEEKEQDVVQGEGVKVGNVQIIGGYFAWDSQSAKHYNNFIKNNSIKDDSDGGIMIVLKDINLKVEQGQFIAIVGQIGSGKSSLLAAVMNEMHLEKGSILISKQTRFSVMTQQPWLMNDTIRNNILFGNQYDLHKYKKIIEICELETDLELLEGKDQTEIGERGVNLSGGQKQRLAIARAIYNEADVYIIDDCLSALDHYVGQKIYQNVVIDYLANKTRLFVTHGLQYIVQCDYLLVMKDGCIVQKGTLDQLNQQGGEFSVITSKLDDHNHTDNNHNHDIQSDSFSYSVPNEKYSYQLNNKQEKDLLTDNKQKTECHGSQDQLLIEQQIDKGKLIQKEQKIEGGVKLEVYLFLVKSAGIFLVVTCVLGLTVAQTATVMNDIWLGLWSKDEFKKSTEYYIGMYILIGIVTGCFLLVKGLTIGYFSAISGRVNQKKLIESIIRNKLGWFDRTPIGRILGRTNKDQDDIDLNLQILISYTTSNIFNILGCIMIASIAFPQFIVIVLVLFYIYQKAIRRYLKVGRAFKRIEAIKRAPAMSFMGETAGGQVVIRMFNKEKLFLRLVENKLDRFSQCLGNIMMIDRWIGMISDLIGIICVVLVGLLVVLSGQINYTQNIVLMGVALTNIMKVSLLFTMTIKMVADIELAMGSVERIRDYILNTDHEKPWTIHNSTQQKLDYKWPHQATIQAHRLSYKYKDDGPLVINDISFQINSFEKIGIVGRTGSGKSTLTLGLLRILELAETKDGQVGKIIIDGIDISKIGLHDLRQSISMIPQDPFLFKGTIRYNVDPFNQYTDQQVIDSLQQSSIWEQLEGDTNQQKLQMDVQDSGTNFSVGQRQLVCMSRAILRNSRLLIMDEATASIDEYTDQIVQKVIARLKQTTVITIAHRINTIIGYDRIMVLDNGQIAQFDKPGVLLRNDGLFRSIVSENGQQYYDCLLSQAKQ